MWSARHGWWFANLPTFWSWKVGWRFFCLTKLLQLKINSIKPKVKSLHYTKSASWKITCHNLWALLVDGFGADITGWNWCWLPRWLKVKILHQKPRSWCVSQRGYRWVSPQINTPNGLEMIQRNGLQIWLDTWFSSWSLGKILYLTNMFQSCNSERPVFVDWCTVPVYPSENQQGIQIQQGNHFANLCFWLSCHFLLHEGKEICETFVGPRRLLRKTLGWISQHNLLVKHEITSLRLFADLYWWAPFSRRVAVESSYHWLFISQLLLVSPKISIHRGPWVIDNPGSLERSSKAVSNVLGCFRRSQSPQCIKASILTSLPLVPHTVETRCASHPRRMLRRLGQYTGHPEASNTWRGYHSCTWCHSRTRWCRWYSARGRIL